MTHPDDVTLDNAPHSRACGPRKHPHGTQCSPNCPTCHAKPIVHTKPATDDPEAPMMTFHPGWGTPEPIEQAAPSATKYNAYSYDNITRETYDTIIESTYQDLHKRVMNGPSQGSPAVSLLLDQIRALEAVRDHLFPKP